MTTYVWLIAEGVRAEVVGGLGAYFTTVKYEKAGIDYEVLVENEDFYVMEDFDYPIQGTGFDCGLEWVNDNDE